MLLKYLLINLLSFLGWVVLPVPTDEIVLSGVYKGVNLYLENPRDKDGGYCVQAIYVNGKQVGVPIEASALEIKLSHLKLDQPVSVRIVTNGCTPRVLNPNVIKDRSYFKFSKMSASDAHLSWETIGEAPDGNFLVFRYQNGEWVEETFVKAKGSGRQNSYTCAVQHHAGTNRYRVKYMEMKGKHYVSPDVEYQTSFERASFYPRRVSDKITFSRIVRYTVLDVHGNVLKKGQGQEVDCKDLRTGNYLVNFDNVTERFFKK